MRIIDSSTLPPDKEPIKEGLRGFTSRSRIKNHMGERVFRHSQSRLLA